MTASTGSSAELSCQGSISDSFPSADQGSSIVFSAMARVLGIVSRSILTSVKYCNQLGRRCRTPLYATFDQARIYSYGRVSLTNNRT